jgi:hypothetical protein
MPVHSFSLQDIIPELTAGLTTFVYDEYKEPMGLRAMAQELKPQIDPKIHVMGKVIYRPVGKDIPEASEALMIKDTKFSEDYYTAPEYGYGFNITTNDLIINQNYLVGFQEPGRMPQVPRNNVSALNERVRVASKMCIDIIKRAEADQVRNILRTGTIPFSNYTTIDFGRDAGNSVTITTANLKWTLANASTMKPLQNMIDWSKIVSKRGNSRGQFFCIQGQTAFDAMENSDEFKADSDIRRNYSIEYKESMANMKNRNIPKGATYQYTVKGGFVGGIHIFTHNETFTDDSNDPIQWVPDNEVWMIADDNVITRQPVQILTFDQLMAMSPLMKKLVNSVTSLKGWHVTPEWQKFTARNLVMGIYRKFLTQPLTPNKTFTAITSD